MSTTTTTCTSDTTTTTMSTTTTTFDTATTTDMPTTTTTTNVLLTLLLAFQSRLFTYLFSQHHSLHLLYHHHLDLLPPHHSHQVSSLNCHHRHPALLQHQLLPIHRLHSQNNQQLNNLFTFTPVTPARTSSPHVSLLEPISEVSFQEPTHLEESNLESSLPVPNNQTVTREEPEFTIIEKGSRKGTDILISRDGYSYGQDGQMNKKREQCSKFTVCNKTINYLASVKQNGDDFKRGQQQHVCKPRDSAIPAANIKAHIRKEGKERPFASGSTLV